MVNVPVCPWRPVNTPGTLCTLSSLTSLVLLITCSLFFLFLGLMKAELDLSRKLLVATVQWKVQEVVQNGTFI